MVIFKFLKISIKFLRLVISTTGLKSFGYLIRFEVLETSLLWPLVIFSPIHFHVPEFLGKGNGKSVVGDNKI